MAVDLWPYSQRENGRVTDQEHEALWRVIADGILPNEPSTAFQVSVGGGSWGARPGRLMIAGHVLHSTETITGPVPTPLTSTTYYVVAAYLDRSTSPWTYGVRLVPGVPGGGRPALQRSIAGRYEVALGTFTVSPTGTVSAVQDDRLFLTPVGVALPATQRATESTDQTWSSTQWSNGNPLCATTFVAPPSGKVEVQTFAYGQGTGNAVLVTAFSIRQNDSAGPVVYNNTTYDGPLATANAGCTATQIVTGLTPGQRYYIRMAHRSTIDGVPVVVRHRRIIVKPLIN